MAAGQAEQATILRARIPIVALAAHPALLKPLALFGQHDLVRCGVGDLDGLGRILRLRRRVSGHVLAIDIGAVRVGDGAGLRRRAGNDRPQDDHKPRHTGSDSLIVHHLRVVTRPVRSKLTGVGVKES